MPLGVPSQTHATAAILPAHQLPPLPVQRVPTQARCFGGIARSSRLRFHQHLGSNEDRCLHQCRQVQRVAGPRVHRLHARRAFHLDGGAIGSLHHPIDPHLPYAPAKGLHQATDLRGADGGGGRTARLIQDGLQRSRAAALSASRSLSPITVAPELTGRGAVASQVASRSNSRKKS